MGYYVYTSDDLIEALDKIYEEQDNVSSYLDDLKYAVNDLCDDYNYFDGDTFYEDLNFNNNLEYIKNMFKQIDEQYLEIKNLYNEQIKALKLNADDRFKRYYNNKEIEIEDKHRMNNKIQEIIDLLKQDGINSKKKVIEQLEEIQKRC